MAGETVKIKFTCKYKRNLNTDLSHFLIDIYLGT